MAQEAVNKVRFHYSQLNITPLECELTDFDNVAACADQVKSMGIPLDGPILNAGIMALQNLEQVEINGRLLEKQIVVNHLGHFVLANHLLDPVKASSAGRVVSLCSAAAYMNKTWGLTPKFMLLIPMPCRNNLLKEKRRR
jgi:NAD(P)-dependent dehydrogenase (short-subunit alcohol dehydrogenase family)